MADLLSLLLVFLLLQALELAGVGILVYRSLARRALDPLGLEKRVSALSERVGSVERYQTTLAQQTAAMEHRLFDRLGALDANQTKVLGHMSEIERIVQSEQRERREITTRIDAVHSALGNFAARFGSVEVSLQKAIDGRVAEGV